MRKKELYLASLFFISNALFATLASVQLGILLDNAMEGRFRFGDLPSLLMLLYSLLGFASTWLARKYNLTFAADWADAKSQKVVESLFARPSRDFRKKGHSEYLNLLIGDMEHVRIHYANFIPLQIYYGAVLVFSFAYVTLQSPWLSLLMLLAGGIAIFGLKPFKKKMENNVMAFSKAKELELRRLRESVEGREDIRANSRLADYLEKLKETSWQRAKKTFHYLYYQYVAYSSIEYALLVFQIALVLLAVIFARRGLMTVGSILASHMLFSQFRYALTDCLEVTVEMKASKKMIEKIDAESYLPAPAREEKLLAQGNGLLCENLSLGYGNLRLQSGLNFAFSAGGCHAIMGESGCGKSTLLKIFCGREAPLTGRVLYGGKDIADYSEETLSSEIAYIEQIPMLFDTSLRKNICIGRNSAMDEQAYQAILEKAQLSLVAERVGEENVGDLLSGGERKRVAFARALAQGAKLLLIDEPTTGLDGEAAEAVWKAIFAMEGITRIIVSHESRVRQEGRFDSLIDLPRQRGNGHEEG